MWVKSIYHLSMYTVRGTFIYIFIYFCKKKLWRTFKPFLLLITDTFQAYDMQSLFHQMQFHQNGSFNLWFLYCINMYILKTLGLFYLTCSTAFRTYLCRVTCEKFYISGKLYWGQFWDWLTLRYYCSELFRMNQFAEWYAWAFPFVISFEATDCMILMKVRFILIEELVESS